MKSNEQAKKEGEMNSFSYMPPGAVMFGVSQKLHPDGLIDNPN